MCVWYNDVIRDPSSHSTSIIVFAICYSIIFILGFTGNLAVIIATVRHRSLQQSVSNIFLTNLAASNLVTCLFLLPMLPTIYTFKHWYFGSFMCRLFSSIIDVCPCIATCSLCAIAVERYLQLVHRPSEF